ncbi:MAG: hypothetical protein HY960_15615 [Ignavibacteriae bacterium]|nr:hypothetical protein [Ignavibacteriota bacterium]
MGNVAVFTKEQNNTFNMYGVTLKCLDDNQALYASFVPLGEAREIFRLKVNGISATVQAKKGAKEGRSDTKESAELQLGRSMFAVSSALSAFAFKTENIELKAKAHFVLSDLDRMRDADLIEKGDAMLKLGNEYKADDVAKKHGVSDEVVAALEAQLNSYRGAKSGVAAGSTSVTSAVKSLEQQFKEASVFLSEYVDKMVNTLMESQPDFYNAYYAARVIRDIGGARSKPTEPPPPAA